MKDNILELVSDLSSNFTKIISVDDIFKFDELKWGKNGIGDRWVNKIFNYTVVYSNSTTKNYSENQNDIIPSTILDKFVKTYKNKTKGIIGIYVHSKKSASFYDKRPIKLSISKEIKSQSCVVCGVNTELVCDHKNDLYNDYRVLNTETQKIDDFQCLCNHCNLKKRDNLKKEKKYLKIYSAKNIPQFSIYDFDFPWEKKIYDIKNPETKKDSYWYDPVEFNRKISIYSKIVTINKEIKKKIVANQQVVYNKMNSHSSEGQDIAGHSPEIEKKINSKKKDISKVAQHKEENKIVVENVDGIELLKTVKDLSVDLILTDPPYIISKKSGMDTLYNVVEEIENGDISTKTEKEWEEYKLKNNIVSDENKEKYIKYGTVYGKKYAVKTNYGSWDSEFTMDTLEKFISEYYRTLRKGGTLIMFFDLWKITPVKELFEKYNFKQLRIIEWVKTNPQPLNSSVNYLTNAKEYAIVGIKGSKPVFNSSYDNGIYHYPLQGGKNRFHPTQKSLALFEELVKKHSNEGSVVMDTFLGAGTTAIACKNTNRNFIGSEISKEYYEKILSLIQK